MPQPRQLQIFHPEGREEHEVEIFKSINLISKTFVAFVRSVVNEISDSTRLPTRKLKNRKFGTLGTFGTT